MGVEQSRRTRNSRRPQGTGKRLDIQGLRALAVLMVVSDHLFKWPSGGFAGVDVFFVISGFLITGLLLREWEKEDAISVTNFYVRRVKRIMPAALTVILVTLVASRFVLTDSRIHSLDLDGVFAAIFTANWRFVSTGVDYFNQGSATSALEHYWSLSVEEQFYFVVPWVMLLLLLTIGNAGIRKRWDRRAAAILVGAITVGSFLLAMDQSTSDPTVAYFSSMTRAWELGAGALLACASPALRHLPRGLRPLIAWAGICGIFVSMFVIDSSTTWPAPGALLPVLATAAVVAAGTGSPAAGNVLLSNPVATYIGDISYSLYLWHFPVVILAGEYQRDHNPTYYVTSLAMMAVFTVASYHAIEKPLHTSPLLTRFGNPEFRRVAWQKWRDDVRTPAAAGGVAFVVAVAGVLVAGAVQSAKGSAATHDQPVPVMAAGPTVPKQVAAVQASLLSALGASTWPDLDPSVDSLPDAGMADAFSKSDGCQSATASNCSFGSAKSKTIAVFGDSLGVGIMPMVRSAYGDTYRVKGLTQISCAITDLDVKWRSDGEKSACLRERTTGLAWIKKNHPDVVLVIQNYQWADRLTSTTNIAGQWRSADAALLSTLKSSTKHVIFVASTVKGKQLADCAGHSSTPEDCVSEPSQSYQEVHEMESSYLPSGGRFVDLEELFCVQGRCPAFAGTTPTTADGSHPTKQYSRRIASAFKVLMGKAGVLS